MLYPSLPHVANTYWSTCRQDYPPLLLLLRSYSSSVCSFYCYSILVCNGMVEETVYVFPYFISIEVELIKDAGRRSWALAWWVQVGRSGVNNVPSSSSYYCYHYCYLLLLLYYYYCWFYWPAVLWLLFPVLKDVLGFLFVFSRSPRDSTTVNEARKPLHRQLLLSGKLRGIFSLEGCHLVIIFLVMVMKSLINADNRGVWSSAAARRTLSRRTVCFPALLDDPRVFIYTFCRNSADFSLFPVMNGMPNGKTKYCIWWRYLDLSPYTRS